MPDKRLQRARFRMDARLLCARPRLGAASPGLMLLTTLATIAATVWLYVLIAKGFLPEQDTGLLLGTVETSQDAHSPPWLSGSAAHVTFGISQSTA